MAKNQWAPLPRISSQDFGHHDLHRFQPDLFSAIPSRHDGHAAPVSIYPDEFQLLNAFSSAGASILAVGYILPLAYMLWSLLRHGPSPNPWPATGLEWTTPSPPPTDNFAVIPTVNEAPYAYERLGEPRAIMSEPAAEIAHQFVDAGQQRDAATFGMWIFLCTEVLLFGALFLAIPCIVCRTRRPSTKLRDIRSSSRLDQYGCLACPQLLWRWGCILPSRVTAFGSRCFSAAQPAGCSFLAVKAYGILTKSRKAFPGQSFHFSDPIHGAFRCFLFFTSR